MNQTHALARLTEAQWAERLRLEQKFISFVRQNGECAEWQGAKAGSGYGQFYIGGGRKNRNQPYAHRVAWEFSFGPIPEGMLVCHRCDNPACVKPSHLFLGTARDNTNDMVSKGRWRNQGRITRAMAATIRAEYAAGGRTQKQIGDTYGISFQQVSRIITGKGWKGAIA